MEDEIMYLAIIVAVLIISGFLLGIRLLQKPETALWGNRLGALCMLLAILYTIALLGGWNSVGIWILLAVGLTLGLILGSLVKMVQMPQMVALLNGFGGAASVGIALAAAFIDGAGASVFTWLTIGLALAVGIMTLSGSLVAALKLSGLIVQQPLIIPGHRFLLYLVLAAGVVMIILSPFLLTNAIYIIFFLFAVYGILLTIRIGGADMPIIISLLNSLSGVAAAICGFAVENMILTGTGAIVGVAGLILTQIMCRAMNRSLPKVLGGFLVKESSCAGEPVAAAVPGSEKEDSADPAERLPQVVREAESVVIIPGYGMAVAQAQQQVKDLIDKLEEKGKTVKIAIHPVAGRMPGHMNVLLAEVGIPYEKLYEMDVINQEFESTDLVIAIGACDVINPAANTAEGTPIYGMPILEASGAKQIVVCNMDHKPGYSGVDNTLYLSEKVIGLWGNAADTVPQITALLD
jgi:H+-translocating NAD(P) transhydrogenase subunit beta